MWLTLVWAGVLLCTVRSYYVHTYFINSLEYSRKQIDLIFFCSHTEFIAQLHVFTFCVLYNPTICGKTDK